MESDDRRHVSWTQTHHTTYQLSLLILTTWRHTLADLTTCTKDGRLHRRLETSYWMVTRLKATMRIQRMEMNVHE